MYFLFHFKQDKTISGILLIQVVKIREYWSLNSEKSQADYDGFFFFFFLCLLQLSVRVSISADQENVT